MDGLPNYQPPPPPKEFFQTNKGKIVALALGIILIGLTLIALNYFKVINLAQQFKFLPRKPSLNEQSKSLTTYTQTTDPAILAKEDIGAFMNENLKPSLISKSYSISSPTDSKGSVLDSRQFNTFFRVGNINASVSLRYLTQNGKRIPEIINASLIIPELTQNLASSSATQITSQYFSTKTKGLWKCDKVDLKDKTNTIATLCENFWTDEKQVKRGVGVMSPVPNEQKTEVFQCKIPPESKIYSWKSCSLYKVTTGLDQF